MLFAIPESLFRLLAVGDVKRACQETRLPFERNQSDAYIEPSFFPRLGDDLEFVATWDLLTAETRSRTLLDQLSIVRMYDMPNVIRQQVVAGVAAQLFRRAIHI